MPEPADLPRLPKRVYKRRLRALQIELTKVQQWARADGERIAVLYEGRDAAGKGGAIKRFREHLNPRGARVVALARPTEAERGQWYFQRYLQHLPPPGEIALFDRSWYNRAGVERVMGFCTPAEHAAFLRQAPELERMITQDGVRLSKYWFAVSREEQRRRIAARKANPLKRWKLSEIDLKAMQLWDDYSRAFEDMLAATDTAHAPWTVIATDDKRRARVEHLTHFLHGLDYPEKDAAAVGAPDPRVVEEGPRPRA
ncbi:MAG: polyphosphate kinase 2 [Pseudomonadota bacterium]